MYWWYLFYLKDGHRLPEEKQQLMKSNSLLTVTVMGAWVVLEIR
jgi:hypothetical protein